MKSVQNTSLNVGLLNAPVKIYAAGSKEAEVKFNYCGPKGEPVEQVYRIKGTDEVVARDNLQKAFDGRMIDKAALAKAEEASCVDEDGNDLKQIKVESFIPLKDIPFERVTGLYYIGPNLKAGTAESFEYFVKGLEKKKAAAIAKVVLRSRQKIFALYVEDGVLHAVALAFKANINLREDSELRQDVKLDKAVLDMMGNLIDAQMADASALDEIEDTYVARKRELAEAAATGKAVEVPEAQESKGGNLLEELAASVKAVTDKDSVAA